MITMKDVKSRVSGDTLKAIRLKLQLSQTLAAQLVGVGTQTWHQWESGRRHISASAWKLLQIYDTGKLPDDYRRLKAALNGRAAVEETKREMPTQAEPGERWLGVPEGYTPYATFEGLNQYAWERYQNFQHAKGNVTTEMVDEDREKRLQRWLASLGVNIRPSTSPSDHS